MNSDMLKKEFNTLNFSDNLSAQIQFVRKLLDCTSEECVNLHYSLLKHKEDDRFYSIIRSSFQKRGFDVGPFLINKILTETNQDLKADAIRTLGHIRYKDALSIIIETVSSENYAVRYASIISIGWMGSKNEVVALSERFKNEEDDLLRGYIATSVRQIFFNNENLKEYLIDVFRNNFMNEQSEQTRILIIVSLQTIADKSFGLRESVKTGDIKGNKKTAWVSLVEFLNKN